MGDRARTGNEHDTIWNRLELAKLRTELAHAYTVEINQDTKSGLLSGADGLYAYEWALKAERIAIEHYLEVLREFRAHMFPATGANRDADAGTPGQDRLESILRAAIASTGADMGNIQILDGREEALRIRAQWGFQQPFLDFFASVHDERGSSCGAALKSAQRVIVDDVSQSEIFAGTTALEVLLDAGVQACQSTPLITPTGKVVGMLNTHYRKPMKPTSRDLEVIDLLAAEARAVISGKSQRANV